MKKKLVLLFVVSLVFSVALLGCGGDTSAPEEQKAQQKFINIATGGTAGTYFPLGGALADIWNKNIEGVNATAESTGASVANTNMLKDGKVDVVFVQNDIAYYAVNGTEAFKDNAYTGMKGLCTLYPETIQIITLGDTGIETLADLKGRKVAVGAPGSGTEANARQILEAAGITYEDINEQYLSFAEGAQNLKDGNVDAAFVTAGFPTASVQDISAQHKVVIVPVPEEFATKLAADYPFYTQITIPAGTYNGIDVDVNTVAVRAMLAVSDQLDDATVEAMLETMYANPERLKVAHKKGEMIIKESGLDGMSIELHPGAKAFFEK